MNQISQINKKLDSFIKRYYLSALIKGVLLYIGFVLLYVLFWIFIEHFFWLPQSARGLVFWAIIVFSSFLFYKLILLPSLKYLSILKGINYEAAAKIIGEAFPEIDDSLLNTLQLNKMEKTDLLLASINQRTNALKFFSFETIIKLKENTKYIKYALAPLLITAPFYLFGKQGVIEDSLKRVVDYNTLYQPPPPFTFKLINDSLTAVEGSEFTLKVDIAGDVYPENIQIRYNNEQYYLTKNNINNFSYDFPPFDSSVDFELFSGPVRSAPYRLEVIKTPSILTARMSLNYPKYTKKENITFSNLGNISVPSGTKIVWDLTARDTRAISFFDFNKEALFYKKNSSFSYNKTVFSSLRYRVSPSNNNLKDYEPLEFAIEVVKDAPPSIQVEVKEQSLPQEVLYFYGQANDDYGVTALVLKYYKVGERDSEKIQDVTNFNNKNLTFYHAFPGALNLTKGKAYELYFEVSDNNPYPYPNKTRSRIFTYSNKGANEVVNNQLTKQKEVVSELERSFLKLNEEENTLSLLKLNQKQNDKLTFSDQQKIREMLQRQEEQEDLLKRFNEQTKKSFNLLESNPQDPLQKEIERRLQSQEKEILKDKKLIKELKDLTNKLNKEELFDRLDEMKKKSKSKQRSLQQMLELTKRFYVRQKAGQIKRELEELSKAQQELSEASPRNNNTKSQDSLNKDFESISKALDSLSKQNSSLTKPSPFPNTEAEQASIKKDQEKSSQTLSERDNSTRKTLKEELLLKAKKSQSKAANKISQLSAKLSGMSSGGGQQELIEDSRMLRQILDNLLIFSFEQEDLILRFKQQKPQQAKYALNLIKQKTIRTHFEHIDDSLFVLSLRQPRISEKINKEISNVFFSIDKSLDLFSNTRTSEGVAAQQYSLTAANNLAELLSKVLSSMEMELSPGQGEGDMQLPDIIMSQEELQKTAEELQEKESESSSGDKESSQDGEKGSKSKGSGSKSGKGKKNNSSGPGKSKPFGQEFFDSEESGEAIMRLYQEQQRLRQALQYLLRDKGLVPGAENVLQKMKKIEQSLINQGITEDNLVQIKNLKYELLKLNNALNEKGRQEQRESRTNKKLYNANTRATIDSLRQKFNSREQLNRQTLPLYDEYVKRVFDYFNQQYDKL
ncbi:MAG: hypothetical protein CL857_04380 [Cryomorphaceae bacterium]|nr:hypothetical protein [Cryomorphaceae bacterium]